MYCGKCGNKLENDAKFCNLCGTPVPPEAEASEGETGENIPFGNTETAEKKESGNGKGIAVIAICVVSAILIIAGTLFCVMRCRRMDEKEISETAPVVEMETAEEAEKPEERPKESADVKEQEPDRKHSTDHLSDLNPSTVWVEGVSGPGEGEAVVIDTTLPYTADGVAILPGYCRDQAVYDKNGRPVKVTVKCGNTVVSESLENFKPDFANPLNSMIYIEFDEPVYTDRYTVVISRAIGGTQYEDTCIAELFPYTYSNTEGYGHY